MSTFSIVTVCYNAEKEIIKTIDSVLNQSLTDYEYLIVDGKSEDRTVELVNSYKDKFSLKNVNYRIISEKDSGIYDAMNKSIEICNGDFILYLNAGDWFANDSILLNVKSKIKAGIDIIYGDVICVGNNNENKTILAGKTDEMIWHMPFCHQCVFTSKRILKELMFETKYKICADYDLFLRCYKKYGKNVFEKLNIPVSYYLDGGFSTSDSGITSGFEMLNIRKEHNCISKSEYWLGMIKLYLKKYIIKYKEIIK